MRFFLGVFFTGSAVAILQLFSGGLVGAEQASDDTAIRVSPAVVEFAFKPGKTQEKTILFTNEGNSPAPYILRAESIALRNATLRQRADARFNISNWITISDSYIVLAPDETRSISLTITPPESAEPGGHYAQLYAQPVLPTTQPSVVKALPEISIPILTTVAGEILTELRVDRGKHTQRVIQSKKTPVRSDFTIENTGNRHVLVRPEIAVFRGDEELENRSISSVLLLPGEIIEVSELFDVVERSGRHSVRTDLYIGGDRVAALTYAVWAMPQPSLILLGFIASVISWRLYVYRKNIVPSLKALITGRQTY